MPSLNDTGVDYATISIASPETIRSWAYRNGEYQEVKNPETINYRTFKPEKGGLFCERIFGPTKDWECACGKYKRIKHKDVICDRCGVEVTLSRVRRDRMGLIELAVPVSHIWFFKCTPTRLGMVLDMTARALERVLYYEDYIVVDPGDTPLEEKQLLSEMEMREAEDKYGEGAFVAKMGAEGVRDLISKIDIAAEIEIIEEGIENTGSKQILKKLTKRLKTMQAFLDSDTRPEWMILEALPVIPPDLRPLVPLEGGRFATSDLNDLYRRVINRNNRLKSLLQLKTPDVIIRNEKRMLQEAVDAMLDNGRHGRAVTGPGNRPLKSLSDMLKGKQGRFRQNLLGKRVDYSGRSVIVVGPDLKMHQCGLPKKMALVLFEPFIIRRLKEMGIVHTVRSAKKLIEREADEVWDILEEVTKGHSVLLNRAPTLHRLSIQAFEPVLIEGSAIRVHPLVCTAYNADFDGDQMAVHVPLSIEAQLETRLLMLASNNIFSPSSGRPITTPSQDICLGAYYVTTHSQHDRIAERTGKIDPNERLPILSDAHEVHTAYDEGVLHTHTRIRYKNPDYQTETIFGDSEKSVITTTVGRVFFNEIWPKDLGFLNKVVTKKTLGDLIWRCYQTAGHAETVKVLDRLKLLGFDQATKSGISIGIIDMNIPEEKHQLLDAANQQLADVESQYRKGVITDGERYNRIVDIWTHATEEITNVMFRAMEYNNNQDHINPIFVMVDSGARGSKQQIRQLAGMRGLMAKPSGAIIERPILSNFREGLTVLEYFISTHGARKGLADTALKTADSGYLTRKLVDVSHDIIVVEDDCGTVNGIEVKSIMEGDEELVSVGERCIGRTAQQNVLDPSNGRIIVAEGQLIDEIIGARIDNAGIEVMKIRSALTCESKRGVCIKCYGINPATGDKGMLGESVGIIAAQSIGEPGTQLTMRTFHVGGVASGVFKNPEVSAKNAGILRYTDVRAVPVTMDDGEHGWTVLNKNGSIGIFDKQGRELERHTTMIGSQIFIQDGEKVKKGQAFMKWDPHNVPIISEHTGKVKFHDFIEGVTIRKELDAQTNLENTVVLEHKEDLHPQIIVVDPNDSESTLNAYAIPSGAQVVVEEGTDVAAGTIVAKTPRKAARTNDITGGLPRVAELFEARKPKDAAEIAKIDGTVDFEGSTRGKRRLMIHDPETGESEEHLIPMGKHVVVFRGDHVKKGQQLTEGPVTPQELLEVCGPRALQEYLVNQVQSVYRVQGVEINDKHIEVIVRQMLRKVKITDAGDTDLLPGDQIDRLTFEDLNAKAVEEGRRPAEASPVLLGITKAALETESFISAASFQDTTRVLTEAAALTKRDNLRGFKENVIMGHLIPAGTGFEMYRDIRLKYASEPISADDLLGEEMFDEKKSIES
ncbi:DNA-directed RNA polymerase subunit beta' [Kiritimatiellota bacterium B12222]|nr:DNA-directed RNA polymerase subunit beta' [Kiritimatiellota bacterium B12222]